MGLVKNITPQYDFWEMNPDLAFIQEFKDIKARYKKNSSEVMWFIVLCYDLDSKFMMLPIDDRTELLSKDYMKDVKWFEANGNIIEPAIVRYQKFDTAGERHLRQWLETLDKRTAFLKGAEYDLDTFEKLDKMATNSVAIFAGFDKIKQQLQKEQGVLAKGGAKPSLADSGDI